MGKTLEKTVKSKKTGQLDFPPDFTRSSNQMYTPLVLMTEPLKKFPYFVTCSKMHTLPRLDDFDT